jgi:hypothetical protein
MSIGSHRSLAFALLTLLGAGCVVPVGPQWSDPEKNYPPTIRFAEPSVGSILDMGIDSGVPLSVQVGLSDQNTADKLYVRWIIDYPPYADGQTHIAMSAILPPTGQPERDTIAFSPSCTDDQIAHSSSTHRLMLAASDRPFLDDATEPDAVPPGNLRIEAVWVFSLACQ